MLRNCSLTIKMLFITAVVGVVVWAISDRYQTKNLEKLFSDNLSNRLSHQAEEQRNLFDHYVKSHHQSVKLFTQTYSLVHYAESNQWKKYKKIKFYKKQPPWLPKLSVIRNFIQPRYLLLLDNSDRVREVYQPQDLALPDELLKPNIMLLSLSNNQGFLTTFNDKPYLVASRNVVSANGQKKARLILAAPLDEQFLVASQGTTFSSNNVIALLDEDSSFILVSSDSSLIAAGKKIESLKENYKMIGQGFFDYGATDVAIVLASFISTKEVEQLTGAVLKKDRQQRAITAVAYILAFVIIIFLVTRRIQNLTNHVVEFSRRMRIDTTEERRGDQISILEETFQRMANAVKKETEALEHQALHDPLTELPNRKLLNNRLQQEILRGERSSKPLVLIMSDLNHFKEVNDTLGHHIGDMVLQQAGLRLFKVFRRTDTVARLGGDEFGILLPETTIDQATLLTRKVVEAFSQPFIVEGHKLSVGISLGLAEFPTHGNDVNILIQRADIAMYQAKRNNLGYAFYDPDKDTHSIGRLALMSEFRLAIDRQALELFYQPKVDLYTGKVIGAEALLRWNHPERGYIDPEEFIPLAEQTGLIKPLTAWVMEEAVKQCVTWKEMGFDFSTSINLSVQNLHDVTLIQQTRSLIESSGLPTSCLIFEITESDIMTDPIRAQEILIELNKMGVTLSIDDFGTGYSSLSYLKQLPVEEIKIDRSFVMEMIDDENDEVIVRATIELAHNLGLKVVGEGVKDRETWTLLRSLGCDIAQGFFICEPLSAEVFTAWAASSAWPPKEIMHLVK